MLEGIQPQGSLSTAVISAFCVCCTRSGAPDWLGKLPWKGPTSKKSDSC